MKQNENLIIVIEDNGVGRVRAKQLQPSMGKGLRMTTELYEILNQSRQNGIHYSITDLTDTSGKPSGTRVEVFDRPFYPITSPTYSGMI